MNFIAIYKNNKSILGDTNPEAPAEVQVRDSAQALGYGVEMARRLLWRL